MGEVVNTAEQTARLEQVVLYMPEARFYFGGEREAKAEELRAFIGDEELSFVSLERFSRTDGGICYYVLLDVSASITKEEFDGIKEALAGFAEGLSERDRMVLITFGEQVQTIFTEDGAALKNGSAREKILALENTDQKTLLFEAIDRMAELSDGAQAQSGMRRAAFVITDGEDIARGKATRQEAERTLKESGVPVYGFTVSGAGKEAEDAFGEFSRESGGTLTILEPGREAEGLAAVKERLMNSWEAVFEADSNRVANGMVNVSLEFTDTGEKKQTQAMQNRWQADEEAPVVLEAFPEGEKQLRVTFSEAVTGADAAEHYELSAADGQILVPVYASAQEGGTEAVLTFDALPAGAYELHCREMNTVPDISDENASERRRRVTEGSIEFRHVSFRYFKNAGAPVLEDVSVRIEPGQLVGIIGSTGSGKSTLVSLIPRLYDPDAGEVLVDGVNVKELSLYELRESVAVVLQKNTLFSGTIAENLRWGSEEASDEELEQVCRIAQADGFIRSFPDGYETQIGQGGGNLSGGQKQRLCIARALLKKPKILILDDSTSAVDTATDAAIRRAFEKRLPGMTKLIIAQRISSVMDADRILVMDEGRLAACGTHEELLKNCLAYQEIYDSQKEAAGA